MNLLIDRFYRSPIGRFAAAWTELRTDEGAILIAWQLLFSLFPLVVGMLSIAGLVLRDPERQAALAASISSQFPEQAADLLSFITETRDLSGIFGIISIVWLLWSGSNLFGTMGIVFDRFYGAQHRSFVAGKLVAIVMMVVYVVLLVVSVASASLTGFVVGLSEEMLPFEIPNFAYLVGWVVSLVSAVLMFLALYRVVPNARIRIWHVWKGALVAGLLFVVLTQIFPLYLHFLGGGFAAYKALGVFLLLMTWFYFLGIILCMGALINALDAGFCPAPSAPRREAEAAAARAMARQAEADSSGPVKVLAWTGLTAAVTSLMLILARRLAGTVWRVTTHREPPS
jgi:membrane protein